MVNDPSRSPGTSRRALLGSVGATVGGLTLATGSFAAEWRSLDDDQSGIVLRQGDRCVPVTPLTGDQSVEEFYDYRIPEQFATETNGGSDPGSGPYYSSMGTRDLQRDGTSLLFLYDGPEGTSLVVVHGSLDAGPSGGGSVTFEIAGLPDEGQWVVRDDYYVNPDTWETASSNYDNWRVDASPQVIDWTWADGRTDGGVFRGLGGDFSVTIDPAFDEAAALFGEHYEGTVDSWQLLLPDGDGVRRVSLDRSVPVTVETGTCGEESAPGTPTQTETPTEPPSEPEPGPAPTVTAVEFKGCGEVWFVFEERFEGSVEVAVETSAGRQTVEITGEDLQFVPGQFGYRPLYKWRTRGNGKILAAETPAGRTDNGHECARAGSTDDRGGRGNENGGNGEDEDRDEAEDRGGDDRGEGDRGEDQDRGNDQDRGEDDRGEDQDSGNDQDRGEDDRGEDDRGNDQDRGNDDREEEQGRGEGDRGEDQDRDEAEDRREDQNRGEDDRGKDQNRGEDQARGEGNRGNDGRGKEQDRGEDDRREDQGRGEGNRGKDQNRGEGGRGENEDRGEGDRGKDQDRGENDRGEVQGRGEGGRGENEDRGEGDQRGPPDHAGPPGDGDQGRDQDEKDEKDEDE